MRYLLDTNICSDLLSNPQGLAAQKLFHAGMHLAGLNWVVIAEMRFGAQQGSERLKQRIESFINEFDWVEINPNITHHYAEIRHQLRQQGQIIGQNDLWIAAHARAEGLILVTHNTREFSRVKHLQLQDWLIE